MKIERKFIEDIKGMLSTARQQAFSLVNKSMVHAYWSIGKRITEEEMKGAARATYGSYLIKQLSIELSKEYGKGFDERELRKMRQFYEYFPIRDALRPELSWTHYRFILRVGDINARNFYTTEAANETWGTRQLERNINSKYYERILATKNKQAVVQSHDAIKKTAAHDILKDPYVFEFLGIEFPSNYSESQLEEALINKLQHFLLELGKGFAFVGRQYAIKTDTKFFYIDLVFYNYILKCFVLVDLKITELTHQDIGQMDMYVRMFEDFKKGETDNPTIGIILCSDKDETVIKYSVLNGSEHLFASRYRLYLPTAQELIDEMQKQLALLKQH